MAVAFRPLAGERIDQIVLCARGVLEFVHEQMFDSVIERSKGDRWADPVGQEL